MEQGKVTVYPECEKCGKKFDPKIGCMWCGEGVRPEYKPIPDTPRAVYFRRLLTSE